MFNILVKYDGAAWETDQLMRMDVRRFKEHSGVESATISVSQPTTLKSLEKLDTLLMYEKNSESPNVDLIRYGRLHDIKVDGSELIFRFEEKGQFARSVIEEFAGRLNIEQFEWHRTHWAVKDAGIPRAMLAKMTPSFDVVLSFAGKDREYVKKVAQYLSKKKVMLFYDENEQVRLWGKDLAEHFELLYRRSGKYCVIFISKAYVESMWTRLERRAALARALTEQNEYILPARFDHTEVPGIPPSIHYISLSNKAPAKLGRVILEKLGRSPLSRRAGLQ